VTDETQDTDLRVRHTGGDLHAVYHPGYLREPQTAMKKVGSQYQIWHERVESGVSEYVKREDQQVFCSDVIQDAKDIRDNFKKTWPDEIYQIHRIDVWDVTDSHHTFWLTTESQNAFDSAYKAHLEGQDLAAAIKEVAISHGSALSVDKCVPFIKNFRLATGCGLYEAKQVWDVLYIKYPSIWHHIANLS